MFYFIIAIVASLLIISSAKSLNEINKNIIKVNNSNTYIKSKLQVNKKYDNSKIENNNVKNNNLKDDWNNILNTNIFSYYLKYSIFFFKYLVL